MEQQLAQLDIDLLVRLWPSFGRAGPVEDTREPFAPAWWTSEEDAAAQFLASQGVAL